jgi:AsmA protein
LPFIVDANKFKPQAELAAESALGRKVVIGNIRLALFSGGVSIEDIAISEDPKFGSGSFLNAKSVAVGVEMLPLIFSRQLHVTGVTIDQPEVTLLRAPSGEWNFSTLGAKTATSPASLSSSSGSAENVSVEKIEIKNGKLTVGQSGSNAKTHEYDQMSLTVSDLSYTSQFPFRFSATTPGNGSIKLSGKAGPLNQTDAAQTPLDTSLEIHALDLTLTGFMDPASGIAGVLDFTGTLSSDGQQMTSKGQITASKMKLVASGSPSGQAVQVDYDTNYGLKAQMGSLKQGDVHIGKAVAHLTGTFNNSGETPSVAMKLTGSDMPAADLEAVLPAVGVTLRVAPEGIRADSLDIVVPTIGSMTGNGTVGADQSLNFQMVANLSGSSSPMGKLGSVVSAGGGQKRSGGGIPFKIQGTTSKPEFVPQVGAMAGNLAKGVAGSLPASGENLGKQLGGLFGKKKQ